MRSSLALFFSAFLIAACSELSEPAAVVPIEVESIAQPAARIVYVTPTVEPTRISTVVPVTPSPSPTMTPRPPTATRTPDAITQQAICEATLAQLYEQASDLCLGKPSGFFCNGGLSPQAEPAGPIASAIGGSGAVVEAEFVQSVHTPRLMQNNSGGLMWLHLEEFIKMNGMLIGDVQIQDVTPPESNFPAWQSFTVTTTHHQSACQNVPLSSFIVQGSYGEASRLVINGVSVDLNGSLVVQTHGNQTVFIVIEGQARVTVIGNVRNLFAGQQVRVQYEPGNFTYPASLPPEAELLSFDLIRHLPVALMDRPVLLPQPGFASTQGRVNMRAEPTVNSRLLYRVPANEVLSILAENEERTWTHIRLGNGETGWMRSDLLARTVAQIETTYDETPVPPQRYGTLGNTATVNVRDGGNLRRAPDIGFPVITTLTDGTDVELLARSPYSPWVKVNAGGQIGWMALITLETRSAISFLPIEYNVPLPPRPTATPVFEFGGGHAYPDPRYGS